MPSGYIYATGPHDFDNIASTASTGIARGDPLKTTSGKVLPLTAGAKCSCVSDGVKSASDSATTDIHVMRFQTGRTRFRAWEKRASGSLAATSRHANVDYSGLTGASGFDSSATGNADIFLDVIEATGASNTGRARVCFADPAWVQY